MKLNEWVGGPYLPANKKAKVAVRYFHIPELKWKGLALGQHDARVVAAIKPRPPSPWRATRSRSRSESELPPVRVNLSSPPAVATSGQGAFPRPGPRP